MGFVAVKNSSLSFVDVRRAMSNLGELVGTCGPEHQHRASETGHCVSAGACRLLYHTPRNEDGRESGMKIGDFCNLADASFSYLVLAFISAFL